MSDGVKFRLKFLSNQKDFILEHRKCAGRNGSTI